MRYHREHLSFIISVIEICIFFISIASLKNTVIFRKKYFPHLFGRHRLFILIITIIILYLSDTYYLLHRRQSE